MYYSYLYECREVPDEIRNITLLKCKNWDKKDGYGYKGKVYSDNPTYQCQLDANSSFSEKRTETIVNTPELAEKINALLKKNGFTFKLAGTYVLNDKRHGECYAELERVDERTWCDLVRSKASKFDRDAAWTVEVKGTKSFVTSKPSALHKADVVLVFYLDTGKIEVLASRVIRKDRTDTDYITCGFVDIPLGFKPISINKNWEISY